MLLKLTVLDNGHVIFIHNEAPDTRPLREDEMCRSLVFNYRETETEEMVRYRLYHGRPYTLPRSLVQRLMEMSWQGLVNGEVVKVRKYCFIESDPELCDRSWRFYLKSDKYELD